MKENKTVPISVDAYISQFSPDVQDILQHIRKMILEAAPNAEEKMSYQMPCYMLNGPLVYYAAYNKHIGFYPTPSGIEAFKDEFGAYKWAKGSVQFPLSKPMPYELMARIIQYRIKENIK